MSKTEFSIWNAIKFGFKAFFYNFVTILIGILFLFVLGCFLDKLSDIISGYPAIITCINMVLGWIVIFWFNFSLSRIALMYYDHRSVSISALFSSWELFFRYVSAEIFSWFVLLLAIVGVFIKDFDVLYPINVIVSGLWAVIGVPLCIVIMVRTQYISYLIIDRDSGIIESVKDSWNMTRGYTWKLIKYNVICGIINIIGVTLPATLLSRAYVYRFFFPVQSEQSDFL